MSLHFLGVTFKFLLICEQNLTVANYCDILILRSVSMTANTEHGRHFVLQTANLCNALIVYNMHLCDVTKHRFVINYR